jgi:hypothetical protein
MTLRDGGAESSCRSRSVRYSATLRVDLLVRRWKASMSVGRPGCSPTFLVFEIGKSGWASAVGQDGQGRQRRRTRDRPFDQRSSACLRGPARGRSWSRWPVRATGTRHATTSSNASLPRRPAITIERWGSAHVTAPQIEGWPANTPYRSQIGPSSAYVSSSRAVDRTTSTSLSPSSRLRMIVSTLPPAPAHPENGTTAIVAPRRSSLSHTSSCSSSPEHAATARCVGRMPPGPTAFGTSPRASPGTSGTIDCADPAQHESMAPRLDASSTTAGGSECPARRGTPGTIPQAMRDDRSPRVLHPMNPVLVLAGCVRDGARPPRVH